MEPLFEDRAAAGSALAERIVRQHPLGGAVVMAIPRGGVPVAYPIAVALEAPLDVLVVRKLGAPWQPELAIGAIAPDGVRVISPFVETSGRVSRTQLDQIEARERKELERRSQLFLENSQPASIAQKTVILVDDGLATGTTMQAAVEWCFAKGCKECVVAVPVASHEACELLERHRAVQCIYLECPRALQAVGGAYQDFDQMSDKEVLAILKRRREELLAP